VGRLNYKALENLALITHIGIVMIIPIFAGVTIGDYLDDRFGTGGIFLLVFILLGIAVSFMNLFKIGLRKSRNKKDQ
jgi:F0F1-type ATP synthase assembly protein I